MRKHTLVGVLAITSIATLVAVLSAIHWPDMTTGAETYYASVAEDNEDVVGHVSRPATDDAILPMQALPLHARPVNTAGGGRWTYFVRVRGTDIPVLPRGATRDCVDSGCAPLSDGDTVTIPVVDGGIAPWRVHARMV